MILDGVSSSAFIHLCRVILYRIMNPTVVSLSKASTVSGRLSRPLCFSFNARLLIQYVLHHRLQDS